MVINKKQGSAQCNVMESMVQGSGVPVVGYFPVRIQEFFHVYCTRDLQERVGVVSISEGKCVCIGGRKIKCLEGKSRMIEPLRSNSRRRGSMVKGLEGKRAT